MAAQIDFLSRSKLEYPAGTERMAFIDQATDTRSERTNFLDQSWIRVDRGVVVSAGGFLSSDEGRRVHRVHLPEVGDMVYQGLPLAALVGEKGPKDFVPSPVSGRILEVNRTLGGHPEHLWQDPCGQGWMAQVQPIDLFGDMLSTRKRTVILAGANRIPNPKLHQKLSRLGCRVISIRSLDNVFQLIRDNQARVLVLDAGDHARNVPQVIKWFSFAAPEIKIVLAGSPQLVDQAISFANHSVPYPLEPFDDTRIADTLQACFQPANRLIRCIEGHELPGQTQRIRISRGWDIWVTLVVSGQVIRQHPSLVDELIRMASGHDCILEAVSSKDAGDGSPGTRVVVLDIHDSGRIPGSLSQVIPSGPNRFGLPEGKLSNLLVQPAGMGFKHEVFDPHTTRALARHVFAELTYDLGMDSEEGSRARVTH